MMELPEEKKNVEERDLETFHGLSISKGGCTEKVDCVV